MSTAIGCEPPIGAVERDFVAGLNGARTVSVDANGRLLIDGHGGQITLVAMAQPSGG